MVKHLQFVVEVFILLLLMFQEEAEKSKSVARAEEVSFTL